MNRTMNELINEFKELSTPCVSDALDKLKINGGCQGIVSMITGKKIVGPAFTVKFVPVSSQGEAIYDYLDNVNEGEVVVIDNDGKNYCSPWGDILSFAAVSKKIAGTVIDGACRDIEGIRQIDYPLFATNITMVNARGRVTLESYNRTISIGNVKVNPGDIIMGDDSGVLVIPKDKAEEILQVAQDIESKEKIIVEHLKNGLPLAEARKKAITEKW